MRRGLALLAAVVTCMGLSASRSCPAQGRRIIPRIRSARRSRAGHTTSSGPTGTLSMAKRSATSRASMLRHRPHPLSPNTAWNSAFRVVDFGDRYCVVVSVGRDPLID